MGNIVSEWIHCPVCGNKTRVQIRQDTELKNFPLFCPKCKQDKADIPHFAIYPLSVITTCLSAVE